MNAPVEIPDGYRENKLGHLVPEATIPEIDLLRDQFVMDALEQAQQLREYTMQVKKKIFSDFQTFMQLSFEKHDVKYGGNKGNVTLLSYDGKYRMQVAVATHMQFNEQLQAAKTLIDECLQDWTENVDDKVKALITHAFQTDTAGKISTYRVLELTRLKIDDPKWVRAMGAVHASLEPTDKSTYIRFSYKTGDDKYETLTMDFSRLPFGEV